MDFLSDQLFDGRKIRVLSIIDNFSRVSPALDVRMSYRGADVVQTLDRLAAVYGRPQRIRLDNVLGHEGKRDLVNRSLCADIERRGMHSEPDGFHRQRDRSLP